MCLIAGRCGSPQVLFFSRITLPCIHLIFDGIPVSHCVGVVQNGQLLGYDVLAYCMLPSVYYHGKCLNASAWLYLCLCNTLIPHITICTYLNCGSKYMFGKELWQAILGIITKQCTTKTIYITVCISLFQFTNCEISKDCWYQQEAWSFGTILVPACFHYGLDFIRILTGNREAKSMKYYTLTYFSMVISLQLKKRCINFWSVKVHFVIIILNANHMHAEGSTKAWNKREIIFC